MKAHMVNVKGAAGNAAADSAVSTQVAAAHTSDPVGEPVTGHTSEVNVRQEYGEFSVSRTTTYESGDRQLVVTESFEPIHDMEEDEYGRQYGVVDGYEQKWDFTLKENGKRVTSKRAWRDAQLDLPDDDHNEWSYVARDTLAQSPPAKVDPTRPLRDGNLDGIENWFEQPEGVRVSR